MMMRNLRVGLVPDNWQRPSARMSARASRATAPCQWDVVRGGAWRNVLCAGSVAVCAMHSMQINYVTLYAKLFNLLFVAASAASVWGFVGTVLGRQPTATRTTTTRTRTRVHGKQLFCHKNMRPGGFCLCEIISWHY